MAICKGLLSGGERICSSSGWRALLGLVLVALGSLWYALGRGYVAQLDWRAEDGKE